MTPRVKVLAAKADEFDPRTYMSEALLWQTVL